jgi:glycosyltransferase involved in cell wall biosynthesis
MAVRHREEFRRCAVLRSFQLTGIIPALMAHARWGTPFVTTYGFWHARPARTPASRLTLRALERIGLRRAAAVIVTTEDLRTHVATLVPADRIHLIPNGVDSADLRRPERRARQNRVLYIGRSERRTSPRSSRRRPSSRPRPQPARDDRRVIAP